MRPVVISGTGTFVPAHRITNEELVRAHGQFTDAFNDVHAAEIASGAMQPQIASDPAFIESASGIRSRYMLDKSGILDPSRLRPRLPRRSDDELSLQAEICVEAARMALERARRSPAQLDCVIVACSALQRAYPAVAIEVQQALGAGGFAFDMNVACSSATFAIRAAADSIRAASARCALVVNPEITAPHGNFKHRDRHFIFGEACTALVLESGDDCDAPHPFEVVSTHLATQFSNNIRNNFGFMNACEEPARPLDDVLFSQNGRQVFREVSPLVTKHIQQHLEARELSADSVRRYWLHQANASMNRWILKHLLGRIPTCDEAPMILAEYGNTSSAGSILAFHMHHADLEAGDLGLLCSFGAGYSVGSVLLRSAPR